MLLSKKNSRRMNIDIPPNNFKLDKIIISLIIKF